MEQVFKERTLWFGSNILSVSNVFERAMNNNKTLFINELPFLRQTAIQNTMIYLLPSHAHNHAKFAYVSFAL